MRINLEEADLTEGILTGAIIQIQNITRSTKFDRVHCQYVYTDLPNDIDSNLDLYRLPRRGNFADGEFNNYVRTLLNTVDLYHHSIQPHAVIRVLRYLSRRMKSAFQIMALERWDDKTLIKLQISEQINQSDFQKKYHAQYEQSLAHGSKLEDKQEIDTLRLFVELVDKTQQSNVYLYNEGIIIEGDVVRVENW